MSRRSLPRQLVRGRFRSDQYFSELTFLQLASPSDAR
jgi:hypothetical protein